MNEEIDLREIKTPCQTITIVDGKEVLKDKKKFRSEGRAQRECNELNVKEVATEMLNTYECSECGKWHLGRNGKVLTKTSKRLIIKENFKVSVVGFIDLTKFEKTKRRGYDIKKIDKSKAVFSPRTEIKLTILGKIDLK